MDHIISYNLYGDRHFTEIWITFTTHFIRKKLKSQKVGLIPPGKMPGSPRIANMGIQLGIEDVGNHHSGMFVNL